MAWASWQIAHPGPENYLPQGGESVCPYPLADDNGPEEEQPWVSNAAHTAMNGLHVDDDPWPGMRLNDFMYPYCLSRYDGTAAHINMTPGDQVDWEALGFTYASFYEVPTAE